MSKPKSLFICQEYPYNLAYSEEDKAEIFELTDVIAERQDNDIAQRAPELLKDVEIIFSGWGAPAVDEDFLSKAPNLKAIFHAAGSVKPIVRCDQFWDRPVKICSAALANSVPVAEFCLAQILLAVKRFWFFTNITKLDQLYPIQKAYTVPGAYRTKVGIITLGTISKLLVEMLKPFDLEVVVYSRSTTEEQAKAMGATKATIDEIFETCDVVSLHTPHLPVTEKMIHGAHFRKMKKDATFINTARGEVVDELELIKVAKERQDLTFLLDVTDPEPPVEGSEILSTRNIIVTPHIAGSLDRECERMGNMMVSELKNYLEGKALEQEIDKAKFVATA